MKRTLVIFSLLSLFSASLFAEEASPSSIPAAAVNTALQWMQHRDPEKRAAAYRTFQLFGDEGGKIYRQTLEKARSLHTRKISDLLRNDRLNPFSELPATLEQLTSERTRIIELIRTDFQKDPSKITMLRDEVASLVRLNEKARKFPTQDSTRLAESMTTLATALAEINRELTLLDGGEVSPELDLNAALAESYDGEVYLTNQKQLAQIFQEIELLSRVATQNKESKWANASQISFANHLNEFRSLFGLAPLELEEKLSDACVGHSQDMAALGFFAHESPVKDKKSPGDRARLAGFQHQWSGENIFMGSSSHVAAYDAWFGSDGHRFIMFAGGPHLIGVGPHGRHWTMMTGRRR